MGLADTITAVDEGKAQRIYAKDIGTECIPF